MSPRNPQQSFEEQGIFQAFLDAYPSLAACVQTVDHPDADFPDVVTRQTDGKSVQWELGEWLQSDQMAIEKRNERLRLAIKDALGDQGINSTHHILFCMVSLKQQVGHFDRQDGKILRNEMVHLIQDVDSRWPHNRSWWSPQGYICKTLDGYSTLKKYIASIHFEPRVRQDKKRYWREDIPWIHLEPQGGSYDPKDALDALIKCIDRKISHYGHFGNEDVRLVIYYNMALLYNTPFIGALKNEPKTFEDVAISSAKYLEEKQIPFKRVYLLNIPENEVFEIYPKFERCN